MDVIQQYEIPYHSLLYYAYAAQTACPANTSGASETSPHAFNYILSPSIHTTSPRYVPALYRYFDNEWHLQGQASTYIPTRRARICCGRFDVVLPFFLNFRVRLGWAGVDCKKILKTTNNAGLLAGCLLDCLSEYSVSQFALSFSAFWIFYRCNSFTTQHVTQ